MSNQLARTYDLSMAVFDSSTSKEPVKAVIESDRYRETFVYVDGKLEEYSLDEKVAKARA